MPFVLLALLLISGGTGIAAENSIPGDTLYPFKIYVNENLESALAITAEGDAEVSVRQAAKRLAEAQKLKEKGELSSKDGVSLGFAFSQEVRSINQNLDKLRAKGDTDSVNKISEEFKKAKEEYSEVYLVIKSDDDSSTNSEDGDSDDKKISNQVRRDDDEEDEDEQEHEYAEEVKPTVTPTKPAVTPKPTVNNTGTNTQTSTSAGKYTLAQVSTHKTPEDCWSVVSGSVYNLTSWIASHPGGAGAIISMCGIDATKEYLGQHGGQQNPERILETFKIGTLQ